MKEWSYKGYTEIKVAVKKARDNIWLYSAKCKVQITEGFCTGHYPAE